MVYQRILRTPYRWDRSTPRLKDTAKVHRAIYESPAAHLPQIAPYTAALTQRLMENMLHYQEAQAQLKSNAEKQLYRQVLSASISKPRRSNQLNLPREGKLNTLDSIIYILPFILSSIQPLNVSISLMAASLFSPFIHTAAQRIHFLDGCISVQCKAHANV